MSCGVVELTNEDGLGSTHASGAKNKLSFSEPQGWRVRFPSFLWMRASWKVVQLGCPWRMMSRVSVIGNGGGGPRGVCVTRGGRWEWKTSGSMHVALHLWFATPTVFSEWSLEEGCLWARKGERDVKAAFILVLFFPDREREFNLG